MRWYEYKMEVDDLHASDDLKAKLLAMQPAEEAPKPARKPKKAIHFPRKALSIAACGLLCGVGLYAAVHSPISLLPAGGAALSSAPETASYAAAYSMDDVNSALSAPKMAVAAGGSADAMSDRDAGGSERRLRSRRRSALYHAAFFRYAEQFDDLAGRFSARFYCIDAHGQGSGVSCRTQLCRSGGRYLCD